jgi:plastocyanin
LTRHRSKAAVTLLALIATLALASCGDSGSSDEGPDADIVSGQFALVPGAPAGYGDLAGKATLERSDGNTATSLSVTGLEPKAEYVAHLHTGSCTETDPGGPHFQFAPGASEAPPNEIHLELSAGADGSAAAQAVSDQEVPPGRAGSIVIHEAEAGSGKGHDHETATGASAAEAVLVHAGHDHDKEKPSGPAKIACAELEGNGKSAAAAGPTVVISEGEPVGGVQEIEVSAGDQVRFTVESDVADEVHVHGYDLSQNVAAGGKVAFDFPAEIEGIFEVELEGRREQIAELRVNP